MLPTLPKDVRWGSFVTHSFLPQGDKRTPTDVCGEAICYPASRSFFLAWFLSFTKLLVLNSLAFMACLLPRRNSRGETSQLGEWVTRTTLTNTRFSHAGKKPLLAGYTMFEKTSFLLYCFQGKLGFLARTIPVFAP